MATILWFVLVTCYSSLVGCTELCCYGYGCVKYDGTLLFPPAKCPDKMGIQYNLYTRKNRQAAQKITVKNLTNVFDVRRQRTIFLVHGYGDTPQMAWLHDTKDALLEKADFNVVIVGWSKGAGTWWYPTACANTFSVGLAMTALCKSMLAAGIKQKALWCVGHSLGAHVCGNAGHLLKFGRVTGLDPAGYLWVNFNRGINRTSGSFVDVIHTDGGGIIYHLGMLKPVGHADFYPNGGKNQPGCYFFSSFHLRNRFRRRVVNIKTGVVSMMHQEKYKKGESCSHSRSHTYFLQSVKSNCFISTHKCTHKDHISRTCPVCPKVSMGYDASPSAKGLFYVPVKKDRPFCTD